MTNNNKHQDTINKYPNIDSALKAVLIDLPTTLQYFAIPYVAYGIKLAVAFTGMIDKPTEISPTLGIKAAAGKEILITTALSTAVAFCGYETREWALARLEDGDKIYAYTISGVTKYGLKAILTAKSYAEIPLNILKASAYGVANHMGYGKCSLDKDGCAKSPTQETAVAILLEAGETQVQWLENAKHTDLTLANLGENTAAGGVAGALIAFNANYIYGNLIGPVHMLSDCISSDDHSALECIGESLHNISTNVLDYFQNKTASTCDSAEL